MVARDTLAGAVGVALATLLLVAFAVTGQADTLPAAVGTLLFVGVGFVLPQAYLLVAGDDVQRTTRLRATALVSLVVLWATSTTTSGLGGTALSVAAGALFLAWVAVEYYLGFRAAADERASA